MLKSRHCKLSGSAVCYVFLFKEWLDVFNNIVIVCVKLKTFFDRIY